MKRRSLTETIVITSGAVEMFAGAALSAFPNIVPPWVAYLCLGIGFASVVYVIFSARKDVWDWLLDRVEQRRDQHLTDNIVLPDLPATRSEAVQIINSSPVQRDQFIALLQRGEIIAWARSQGFKNLRPVPAHFWLNSTLEFAEIEGVRQSLVAPPSYGRTRPWRNGAERTQYYDVHFSKQQLTKFWKDRQF